MKIALLMRDDPNTMYNGLSTYCSEITKALKARGHEIEWFIGKTDYATMKLGGKIPARFDLIYCVSLPYGKNVKLPMVAKCNSPLKEEGKYYPGLKKLKGLLGQYAEVATLSKARAVISVSKFTHDILKEEYSAESVVIPDGVDSEFYHPMQWAQTKPFMAHRSRDEPRKNMAGIRLAMNHLGDRVNWTTRIQEADIFLTTSFSEAFNISLLEAMASGCACLASDIPAHRELIRQGIDGYLFGDETEMKEHLDDLIEFPELRKMLGGYAREKAKNYTWSRTAELTEKVYKSVVG